jgi:hypothetical protein
MNFFILSLWIKLTQRIIEGPNQTWPNDNKDEINDLSFVSKQIRLPIC